MNSALDPDRARRLLCSLGDHIRSSIRAVKTADRDFSLSAVSRTSIADTIYEIDAVGEQVLVRWFETNWPSDWPAELVAEGFDEVTTFPRGTPVEQTRWKCIIDPIDGTRGLMYDKRSAWVLAAIAPQRGPETKLSDLIVAAMTELPTAKQWRADQISAVRGNGIVAESCNVLDETRQPLAIQPSRAVDFKHGFASLAKFFPEGRALTARIEERLWDTLYGLGRSSAPIIFDDQYISTGGQFYEILVGHDRMIGDLRPLLVTAAGLPSIFACHPYDACTALLLTEAGCVLEHPLGGPVDAPLDITTPISWIAYANASLAELARPILHSLLAEYIESDRPPPSAPA